MQTTVGKIQILEYQLQKTEIEIHIFILISYGFICFYMILCEFILFLNIFRLFLYDFILFSFGFMWFLLSFYMFFSEVGPRFSNDPFFL